jgi:hypothetical protein
MPKLAIITFGYEVGPAPADCVWTADVRNIPADVVAGLYDRTGMDEEVQDKILATPQAQTWIAKFKEDIMPQLQAGDRIAIGCSIGVHRSVAIAQELARIARAAGFDPTVQNRDLGSQRDTSINIEHMSSQEVRAIGDVAYTIENGLPRIDARAIIFDSWSEDLGGFRERMMPGSTDLSPDMVALFDHDTSMVIGRVSAGTMQLRQDSNGVSFTAYPPDTTWAADLKVSMERGDIRGCSFRMLVEEDEWYLRDGQVCRDVKRATISELTITSMPAYPATTAEARSRAEELATAIPATLEQREAQILDDDAQQQLKDIYAAIEIASDKLEQTLMAIDPTFMEDQAEAPEEPAEPSTEAPEESGTGSGPASESMNRSVDGASTSTTSTAYAAGFGFIKTKRK